MAETPPPTTDHKDGDGGEVPSSLSAIGEDARMNQEDNHTQSQSEMLTQNDFMTQNEMTQLGDDFEDYSQTFSPMPPSTPINPRNVPWGRLIPCIPNGLESGGDGTDTAGLHQQHQQNHRPSHDEADETRQTPTAMPLSGAGIELFPKDPTSVTAPLPHVLATKTQQFFMGLSVKSSDKFNEHEVGRSQKCHVRVPKPPTPPLTAKMNPREKALTEWGYGMISNRHCRILCMLKGGGGNTTAATSANNNSNNNLDMEVYLEDTSGNGTLINNTTLLRKGEKRLLHTGDEICLINPFLLRKRVRSTELQTILQRRYSFIFVNLYQQQGPMGMTPYFAVGGATVNISSRLMPPSAGLMPPPPPSSVNSKRRGFVDVKALNNHSFTPPIRSISTTLGATPLPLPSPLSLELTNPAEHQKQPPKEQQALPQSQAKKQHQLQAGWRKSPRQQRQHHQQQLQKQRQNRRIEEYYDIRDVLGTGTCGEVRRAIHRRTGVEYAVKVISLSRNGCNRGGTGQLSTEAFEAEAAMLQALDHPYIVKLVDVFVDHHNRAAVYLIMELLHGGDLFDRIIQKGRYTETESRRVMRRLLSAVYYLHEGRHIVHRDLKPENILCVNQHPKDDITIKLTDFGLAKSVTEDGLKTFCGTPQYFAPEVLRRQHTVAGRGRYGKQADMWSLGVILYVLLSGAPPFDGARSLDAVEHARISFPATTFEGVSSQAIDLVRQLLLADPQKRISVKDACAHIWILQDDGDTHTHPLDDPVVKACCSDQNNVISRDAAKVDVPVKNEGQKVDVKEEPTNKLLQFPPQSNGTDKESLNGQIKEDAVGSRSNTENKTVDTKQAEGEEKKNDHQVPSPDSSTNDVNRVDSEIEPSIETSNADDKKVQDTSPKDDDDIGVNHHDTGLMQTAKNVYKFSSRSHDDKSGKVDTPDKECNDESNTAQIDAKKIFSPRMLNKQIEQFRKVVAKSVGSDIGQSSNSNQERSLPQVSTVLEGSSKETVTPSPPKVPLKLSIPAASSSLQSHSVPPNDLEPIPSLKNKKSLNLRKRGRHDDTTTKDKDLSYPININHSDSTNTATSKTLTKSSNDETTKAVELTEDEICSQFSDEDSVSSFGTSAVGSNNPNNNGNLERMPSTSSSARSPSSLNNRKYEEHGESENGNGKENNAPSRKRQKAFHPPNAIEDKEQGSPLCEESNTKPKDDKKNPKHSKKKMKNVSSDTKNKNKTTASKSRRRTTASSTTVKKKKTQTTLSSWFTNKKTWTAK